MDGSTGSAAGPSLKDPMKSALVVSSQKETSTQIQAHLKNDFKIQRAATRTEALAALQNKRHDLIFIDLGLLCDFDRQEDFRTVLQTFWRTHPSTKVVVVTPQDTLREAVMAVKAGASDYILHPINSEELSFVTRKIYDALIRQSELDYLRDRFWQAEAHEVLQTRSDAMRQVFYKIRSVAPTRSTVLLAGETGTGKSVLAKLIHRHSNRRDCQFISVHCGAISDTLLESELFGHEKGAFTGAVRKKLGKFEIAKGGTILLDEIGTITPAAQIKLLGILQDGIFQRVGGEETIDANVRVIAATNSNLKEMSGKGTFRKDLYYRLNVFPIEVPPLRARREDIPFFVAGFLEKLNSFQSKAIHDVHPQVLEALQRYSWPGNIRELENLVERAYILEKSAVLTPESFPGELFESALPSADTQVNASLHLAEVRRIGIAQIERRYIKELLGRNHGRINQSAAEAAVTTRQLHKLMKKYGIRKEEFKQPR
jgi:DNA-binding NtrC family response regulator